MRTQLVAVLGVCTLVVGVGNVCAQGEGKAPLPLSAPYRPAVDAAVQRWIAQNLQGLEATYKNVHANPELSLAEGKTAALVATQLRRHGYEVTPGIGGTGVVGVLHNGEGPTVLVRGDMDALPITEETGLSYASVVKTRGADGTTVGVMHACGHDLHTTVLLGTAALLPKVREHWRGTVVILAQPAEEVGKGAKMMIDDGLFARVPRPNACLALHVAADLSVGDIGYTAGFNAANVDSVDITVFGRGGHGARPQDAIDPIVTAAHLVTALQTLVSRRVDPVEPAVVTVGSIHGGSKHNIIPDEVRLQLTVRSYTEDVRTKLLDGIRQIATDTCRTFACPQAPEVVVKDEQTPAAYNDPDLTAAAAALFQEMLGEGRVIERPAEMGGEDFGRYASVLGVPGLMFRLGTVPRDVFERHRAGQGPPLPSLHSSRYAPDAGESIASGVRAMGNLVVALLASD